MYDSPKFYAQVVWDPGQPGEVVFDTFFGGVNLASETQVSPTFIDKYGITPYDQFITGTLSTLTLPITYADGTALENLAGAVKSGDTYAMPGHPGLSLRAGAKQVYVKPVENGIVNTDPKKWYHIPVATKPVLNYSGVYDVAGDQEIFTCTIHALAPDDPTYEGKPVIFGVTVV